MVLRGDHYQFWRTVDKQGAELDALVQKWHDVAAEKDFLLRRLRSSPVPRQIVTDHLQSSPATKADILEFARAKHFFIQGHLES